jgi:AraC-like DNA-binding protein
MWTSSGRGSVEEMMSLFADWDHVRQDKMLVRSYRRSAGPADRGYRLGAHNGATRMQRLNPNHDDDLSVLLRAVNVYSTVYCVSDCGAPWGFRVAQSPVAKFHLVVDGRCVLRDVRGFGDVELHAGEFALLPHGDGHVVSDGPRSRARALEQVLIDHPLDDSASLEYGGRGRRTKLVCGGWALDERLAPELRRLLPRVIRLDTSGAGLNRWIEPLFALLHEESRPGEGAVFAKIADVFLTETLRGYLAAASEAGIETLEPLTDPAVSSALALLRDHSDESWTVGELAHKVGLSRTQFSARFRTLVGETPMRYLTKMRLTHAAGLLVTTNDNLYAIACATGYETEASFSKAFKRAFEYTPGEYRRTRRARPIDIGDIDESSAR